MASKELGELGPTEGEPVAYHRPLSGALLALLPWAVVFGLLFLPPNRTPRAWAAPVIVVVLFSVVFFVTQRILFVSSGFTDFILMYKALALGLCALWLVSHSAAGLGRQRAFVLAAVFLAVASDLIVFYEQGFAIPQLFFALTVIAGIQALVLVVALALAGVSCRKQYSPWRFARWTALWLLVANAIGGIAFFGFLILVAREGFPGILQLLLALAMFPLILSAGTLLILVPFLLLTFHNRLFRERFYAIFRLPGMAEPPKAETAVPALASAPQ